MDPREAITTAICIVTPCIAVTYMPINLMRKITTIYQHYILYSFPLYKHFLQLLRSKTPKSLCFLIPASVYIEGMNYTFLILRLVLTRRSEISTEFKRLPSHIRTTQSFFFSLQYGQAAEVVLIDTNRMP